MKKQLTLGISALAGLLSTQMSAAEFKDGFKLPQEIHRGSNVKSAFGDFDQDGKNDLIIANYRGVFSFAKNIGDNSNPKFAKPTELFTLKHW